MKLNGAEILMECLLEQKVNTIFGYPGGAVLFIYDALYKYQDKITHHLTSHEQGAAHAADGYARASGKVGVCLATSGPGATNLVTGIATAYMDSVPMVAITGNVGSALLGKDSFQEVDIAGVTMPITKHNFIVKDVTRLADTVRRAFYIAQEGRPGPVLIDITKDATSSLYEYDYKEPLPIPKKTDSVTDDDISRACALIEASKKPLIYGGGGLIRADAAGELLTFAEKIDSPVTLSTMGLGAFPASNPRFTGMIGMHGAKASNLATLECDLLIAIGARFSDRVASNVNRFAPNAKILHLDIDPAEINKNVTVHDYVVGDVSWTLHRLNKALEQQSHPEWMAKVNEMKKNYPITYPKDNALRPQYVMEKVSEVSNGDAIVVTDVGQHQMFAAQYIKTDKPRHFLTSGGLGTMGFGLGAAVGASLACPDKVVFEITGDGCFGMNNIELATAVEYGAKVIVILINNHTLGMVRQWQKLFYDKRYSHTTLEKTTDFHKLAEAYQVPAFTVTKQEEVEEVLKKAVSMQKTVFIQFDVDRDNHVYPMIPAGMGIDEFVDDE